jgi:hypothetical protein
LSTAIYDQTQYKEADCYQLPKRFHRSLPGALSKHPTV